MTDHKAPLTWEELASLRAEMERDGRWMRIELSKWAKPTPLTIRTLLKSAAGEDVVHVGGLDELFESLDLEQRKRR